MNLDVPDNWTEVNSQQFYELLSTLDSEREAYANGKAFYAKGYEKYLPHSKEKLMVAIHLDEGNRFYIDLNFFNSSVSPNYSMP